MKDTDFAYYLTKYLTEYLPHQRNVSENTLRSYRDVIKQLILYLDEVHHLKPEKIQLMDLTRSEIISYLNWLENEHHVSISTGNQRLAAIHSFYRYLQSEVPDILYESQKILGIPFKKSHREPVGYLETECIHLLLHQPDNNSLRGLRDCAILRILYDTVARVQKLIDLKVVYISDYLGHVSVTTTEIYLKTMNRLKTEAFKKLMVISKEIRTFMFIIV